MTKLPMHDWHVAEGALMAPFAGWNMPIHYGSQKEEHTAVRTSCGMFDVSHMTVWDVTGNDANTALKRLMANNVDKLDANQAQYTCMLNAEGGIVDDLIVYRLAEQRFRLVTNGATKGVVSVWLQAQTADLSVNFSLAESTMVIAVQGPEARDRVHKILPTSLAEKAASLSPFSFLESDGCWIARTGYTGEDGYELMCPVSTGKDWWLALAEQGVPPIGLAARDTLRLEAGLNLYGQDMTSDTTPYTANIGWTVALDPPDREFVGRQSLAARREREQSVLVGLLVEGRVPLRSQQSISLPDGSTGVITSGAFSPTLGCPIAMARVPHAMANTVTADVRGKTITARVVRLPFYRAGKIMNHIPEERQHV